MSASIDTLVPNFVDMRIGSLLIALVYCLNTLQAQDTIVTTIGILGCHNQGNPAPAIPYMATTLKPQFTVWVGDNVYADTETDPNHILTQLNVLLEKPGFKELRAMSKFYVTWDDHDYGLNDAGKNYIFKVESKQIHRTFWQLEAEIPANQDGIYYANVETLANDKKVQFIMLDGRYNKDKQRLRKGDALGENQWNWLEEQLQVEADVRFITNGYQILLKRPNRWEAFNKIGKSRKRLFELIAKTKANNIVFITGDQHYVEVLKSPKQVKYKTFEIMAAGINKTERPGIAKNRVMGPDVTVHAAPIIEIHWAAEPYIHFKNYDVVGNKVSTQFIFKLSDIGWKTK